MEEKQEQDVVDFSSWKGLEKELCAVCQKMLIDTMKPIQIDLNSESKFKQAKAQLKLSVIQPKLWKNLCKPCLKRMKKEVL